MQHPPPPVEVGDISLGTIVRIETYGAFCALRQEFHDGRSRGRHHHQRPPQGLIHISQLADIRVEKVEDVVDVDDEVWVKVVDLEKDEERNRWRIKLSMKDVAQDGSRTDLGKQREQKEQIKDQLEVNLNSMIGMGVARDPMADSHLTMKNNGMGTKSTFRGGYSLVGDDEGEAEQPPAVAAVGESNPNRLPPVGRGRGTTLPAWMTSGKFDGPTGMKSENDDDDEDNTGRTKKKSHKKHSSKSDHHHHRKNHKRHSSSKKDKKSRRERHRRRSRSRSYDTASSREEDSRNDDNDRRRRSRGRNKRHKSSRHRRRSNSRDTSREQSDNDSDYSHRERGRSNRRTRSRSRSSSAGLRSDDDSRRDNKKRNRHHHGRRRSRSRSYDRGEISREKNQRDTHHKQRG